MTPAMITALCTGIPAVVTAVVALLHSLRQAGVLKAHLASEAVFENPEMTATVGHSLPFAYQATYTADFCTGITVTGSSPEAVGYFKPALLEGQQQLRGDG